MSESPNYYAIIPANVRYAKDIVPNAKLLYGELTALTNQRGYCWATNKYFADLYGVDRATISRWVASLVKAGFVRIDMSVKRGNERKIYLTGGIDEKINRYRQKDQEGIDEKVKHNNTGSKTGNDLDSKESIQTPEKTEEVSPPSGLGSPKNPSSPKSTRVPPPRDPRCDHPAILAIKGLMGRWPDKILWDDYIARFGNTVDKDRLEACRKEWVERGVNNNSLKWVNWYFTGIETKPIPARELPRRGPTQTEAIEAEQRMIEAMALEQ